MDNLSSGQFDNIRHLMECPDFRLLPGNISDPSLMEDILKECRMVFHLAAMVSVPESLRNPMACHAVNTTAFLNILQAAKTHKTPVVYASSSAVYGMGDDRPRKETDPTTPCSPYGASKLIDETYAAMAWQAWKVPSLGLRFFNVYGSRQNPDGEYSAVIAKFASRLQAGKAPVVHGDGSQVRDFIHVDDAVRALLAAATRVRKLGCAVVNVGSGRGTSIMELSNLMQRTFRCLVSPIMEPARPGDIRASVASTEKMVALLGVRTSITLEAGLKKAFQAFSADRERAHSLPVKDRRCIHRGTAPGREGPER
jgi:nucleoside-diphosphate-sugar epimerase